MEVFSFSEDTFAAALSNEYTDDFVIRDKHQFKYFNRYLGEDGLMAKTFVIEEHYISKDFLHDFASYYAFCFEDYPKYCKRIHFFSSEFDIDQLKGALLNIDEEAFWEAYLGFIVVKPIPITVVGYTVLKVYENGPENYLRRFWGLRNYKVHFFGKELVVNSLAFQEQDSILAACATTAIWSMLNKASIDFNTILKVPSEITKDADRLSNDGSRLFPNKGLDVTQIGQAINNSGLAPEVRVGTCLHSDNEGNEDFFVPTLYLKKILNAYELIGIPIILGIKVPIGDSYGYHAIAVSGHKFCSPLSELNSESLWLANRIEKMYVHDDQFGPFAWSKMLADGISIESPWTNAHERNWLSYVVNMIIPVYPKIRISYENIEVIVIALNGILIRAFENQLDVPLHWDIKLFYSEGFKKTIHQSSLDAEEKIELLGKSMPKYLWVATCYFKDAKFMEFTFDATDVSSGMLGEDVICYFDPEVQNHLLAYIQENGNELISLFKVAGGMKYIQFLINLLS